MKPPECYWYWCRAAGYYCAVWAANKNDAKAIALARIDSHGIRRGLSTQMSVRLATEDEAEAYQQEIDGWKSTVAEDKESA